MPYKVPDNVVNKTLYLRIKNKIQRRLEDDGKRWSAYASGQLVKQYKAKGGKYTGRKSKRKGLSRWFAEKWVDVCYWPKRKACGRPSKGNSRGYARKYPYCRPSKRITKSTPKTVQELTKKQRQRLCKKKRKVKSKKRVLS